MWNLKKRLKNQFIEICIKDLKGLKRAEWYKARPDRYQQIDLNVITEICTFQKLLK